MAPHHLAQLNVARGIAEIDGPELAEFRALLDPINELADRSPGFVWRLQTEDGDATGIRAFDDPRVIVNMSVWETIEALWRFVYDSDHLAVMRRRREWFVRDAHPYMVLWWIPAGSEPTLAEALDRLAHLTQHGPTPRAFTFKRHFPSPAPATPERVDERSGCPA